MLLSYVRTSKVPPPLFVNRIKRGIAALDFSSFTSPRIASAGGLALLGIVHAASAQMTTPASLSVTDTGAAIFTIPITVPPGTAGMQPKLQLSYSSHAGNGLLGLGWSLGGLPAITRCPRTVATDGIRGAIKFDGNDRFCLDGQRLVLYSGTYGAANAEYRTEIESFTKILDVNNVSGGGRYFKVWTKSGQIIEFGNTADSKIEAKGRSDVLVWAANKISDVKGNFLAVTYTEDTTNGSYRPARVDYTGNDAASVPTYASVRFDYEPRSDSHRFYVGGSMVKTTMRMTRVYTYVGENLVQDYRIAYDSSSVLPSRITSITQCAGNVPATCLPAVTFGWQGSYALRSSSSGSISWGTMNVFPADFDGSGTSDVIWQDVNPSGGTLRYLTFSDGGIGYTPDGVLFQSGWTDNNLILGDWNGDGQIDVLLQSRVANGTNRLYRSNGGAFVLTTTPLYIEAYKLTVGDWNGDGRSDLLLQPNCCTSTNMVWLSNGDGTFTRTSADPQNWQMYTLTTGDFNGDGCTDLLMTGPAWDVQLSDCNGGFYSSGFTNPPNWNGYYDFIPIDINGDGCTDLLLKAKSSSLSSSVQFSDCRGQFETAFVFGGDWSTYDVVGGDFNGDGKTDLIMKPKSGGGAYLLYMSSGEGLLSGTLNSGGWDSSCYLYTADWDGDGATDLMTQCSGSHTQHMTSFTPYKIATIANGLGSINTIVYDRLSKGAPLYGKNSGAPYPIVEYQGALYVVKEVKTENGAGGTVLARATYTYEGAKHYQDGRGFVGFAKVTVKDELSQIKTAKTFSPGFPYTGLVVSLEKTNASGTILNRVLNAYTYGGVTITPGNRYFPRLTATTEYSKDLNGTSFPDVVTTFQYDDGYPVSDAKGNITQIVTSTTDASGSYTKTTTNTYLDPVTTNWILGRLISTTVTSVTP